MAKVINEVKKEGKSFGKVLAGSSLVAVGGAIGDFVGALVGGYVAKKTIVKSGTEKDIVEWISYLTAADLLLEKIVKPRGLI